MYWLAKFNIFVGFIEKQFYTFKKSWKPVMECHRVMLEIICEVWGILENYPNKNRLKTSQYWKQRKFKKIQSQNELLVLIKRVYHFEKILLHSFILLWHLHISYINLCSSIYWFTRQNFSKEKKFCIIHRIYNGLQISLFPVENIFFLILW